MWVGISTITFRPAPWASASSSLPGWGQAQHLAGVLCRRTRHLQSTEARRRQEHTCEPASLWAQELFVTTLPPPRLGDGQPSTHVQLIALHPQFFFFNSWNQYHCIWVSYSQQIQYRNNLEAEFLVLPLFITGPWVRTLVEKSRLQATSPQNVDVR